MQMETPGSEAFLSTAGLAPKHAESPPPTLQTMVIGALQSAQVPGKRGLDLGDIRHHIAVFYKHDARKSLAPTVWKM